MPPLGSGDRHPAPSQKLPTSKQLTLPAAPASAPPLLSTFIALISVFWNLLPRKPPHSLQTGVTNLVANKTIDSSCKERVPQQQSKDIGNPTSILMLEIEDHAIARSFTRAGRFMREYYPLSACFNNNEDAVIPCTGTLEDRPPSLLPLPIDGSGQPLLSPESTSSPTVQAPIDDDGEETIRAGQSTGPPAVNSDGILHIPVSPRPTHSFSFFIHLGARARLIPSRLPALIMVFFPLLTSPPVFLSLLPSGARALSPRARVRLILHQFLVCHPRPLGCIFSPLPSPQLSPSSPHQSPVLACLPVPSPLLPTLPALLASLHSLLLRLRQVAQSSAPCPFLADIACHHVSFCSSLIFLPPPSFLFPSATGESN